MRLAYSRANEENPNRLDVLIGVFAIDAEFVRVKQIDRYLRIVRGLLMRRLPVRVPRRLRPFGAKS